MVCSNTRSTRNRPAGADARCPRSCSAATMRRSRGGDVTDVSSAPPRSDRTCSPGSRSSARRTEPCSSGLSPRTEPWQNETSRLLVLTCFRGMRAHSEPPDPTDGFRGEIPTDDPVTDQPVRYACPRPEAGATGEITMQKLDVVDAASLKSDVPEFRAGDTLDVHVKVIEGSRSRIQVFRGIVIRRQGDGVR